jgi:hypothetical protein
VPGFPSLMWPGMSQQRFESSGFKQNKFWKKEKYNCNIEILLIDVSILNFLNLEDFRFQQTKVY